MITAIQFSVLKVRIQGSRSKICIAGDRSYRTVCEPESGTGVTGITNVISVVSKLFDTKRSLKARHSLSPACLS